MMLFLGESAYEEITDDAMVFYSILKRITKKRVVVVAKSTENF